MNGLGTARWARCLIVWAATTAAVVVVVLWSVPDLPPVSGGRLPFDRMLVQGCALALVLCAGWWWAVTTVVVLEALVGTSRCTSGRAVRGVPAPARRWLLAACGVVVLSGGLTPAHATPGSVHRDDQPRGGAVTLDGLPLPERPIGGLGGTAGRHQDGAARQVTPARVVVQPGDSLWEIAATALGPGADPAAVSAHWQRIHQLNRHVVGADPDVIHPGQHLAMPSRPTPPRGES
ncbi:hypothetical protein NPS01_24030 [Nocardioides psychrotolerans]|uniref:LysM domain-containing protein n=1 Tax=Nocardioides psychrotolerans TaxID=1005945 RepID=A0A1I3LC09_9ACTN|nr:LysM domain-containing protein [Nocardioides psychrotolerans]GEP38740.1 hypothetical protein NPS01_24030 [Nocardioides psychrotolerans]SFI82332.1 LysM domain-containing protein [Nocardioides psychrotolerans]